MYQNRGLSVGDYFARFAPEKQSLSAASAMGTHNDQIGGMLVSSAEYGFRWTGMSQLDRGARNSLRAGKVSHFRQAALAVFSRALCELLLSNSNRDFAKAHRPPGRRNREERDGRTKRFRDLQSSFGRAERAGRSVNCDEDVSVHGVHSQRSVQR